MGFERLELRAESGRRGLPASVSLSCHGGGRPAVIVALTAPLVREAAMMPADRLDALIGTGADAGKIRLQTSAAGLLKPRLLKADAFLLNLGFIAAIGAEPRRKVNTTARVIGPGLIEVDVPQFPADDDEDADEAVDVAATTAATVPAAPPRRSARPSGGETINGVTVDLTSDAETVSFKGEMIEVTARGARLVRLLARPRPSPVAESFLVNALWEGKPPASAMTQLRELASDLAKGLAPIGLALNAVKGIGLDR